MSAPTANQYKDRTLLAVIGDEDSVTGLLLAGIGHISEGDGSEKLKNFYVTDAKTSTDAIEKAFDDFTQERKDIAILLINQHVSHQLHPFLLSCFPFNYYLLKNKTCKESLCFFTFVCCS